jgi:hypothetical protein
VRLVPLFCRRNSGCEIGEGWPVTESFRVVSAVAMIMQPLRSVPTVK